MTLPTLDAGLAALRDPLANRTAAAPERVVQWGTGALLRGLVLDALDRAARPVRWSGRVVLVSQTGSGRGDALGQQDGLFTLRERGVENGEPVDRARLIGVVARTVSAVTQWDAVLATARQPEIDLVVSNTTEIGLTWDDADDAAAAPPRSFPARLAAWLHARARAFDGDPGRAVVVLPTELVDGNGALLKSLVLRWAERAAWPEPTRAFIEACPFADTLVDRIVPGAPPDLEAAQAELGYVDALVTDTEPYRLWAIEGDRALASKLRFASDDPATGAGIVVVPSVEPFRLRKVRLLNAAHTLLVPVALGVGLETVREAVEDAAVGAFVRKLVGEELVPAVAADLAASGADPATAAPFAAAVLDRFANPFLRHELRQITLHQTSKLGVRALPSAQALAREGAPVPPALAFGLAAFFHLHAEAAAGRADLLDDGLADALRAHLTADAAASARAALADADLWGADWGALWDGAFADAVAAHADAIARAGVPAALDALLDLDPARP